MWVAGTGLAAILLGSLWWGFVHASNMTPRDLSGQTAPEMTIADLRGGEVNLSSFHGTPVVVNIWASWCVPCRQEAPVLNAAARDYQGRVRFIGVDIQDADAPARAYQAEVMSPYPVGPAVKGTYRDWGVTAPPETFFIDRQGLVIVKVVGPVDRHRLDIYLSQLSP